MTQEQKEAVVKELRAIRDIYDDLEIAQPTNVTPLVTWRGWKMVRNVISDRIEELTGGRV